MTGRPIYLDYNATTPVDPAVAEAMLPYLREHFGNPSSTHSFGVAAKRAIEKARAQVAGLLGCLPEEILFTSGGSESNNMVIKGVAEARSRKGRHIITSAVEHPAVLEPCEALEALGFDVTVLPVDDRGRVKPEDVDRAITPETILVTIMHANNEVGTIQPVEEIAAITGQRGILLHTDAAQSAGKIRVQVDELGVDFLSLAGHKLYAPKGVGALYIRSGRDLPRMIHGAGHESGRRAGTENVLEVVGLGEACELAASRLEETASHCRRMRDRLWEKLRDALGELRRNGTDDGLPNTLSVSFRGIDATTLLAEIGDRVAASAGAACHAEGVDLSTVLKAMQVPMEEAMGTVRFSVGRGTTATEVDEAARVTAEAVKRMGRTEDPTAPARAGDAVRLTRFTHGMGCACKLRPQELEQVLRSLPPVTDRSVLVGTDTSDDAAVYRLREDLAIVQTVDFFTPIADDPYQFGAISAANSLSDLYAMGAKPIFALSVVGFPSQRLPLSVLEEILRGAAEVAREAGIQIVGGHSVEDTEPKFGLAVSGTIHPDRILTNSGARPGDALVLTKPIGTGIIATAVKRGMAGTDLEERGLAIMRALNRTAAEAMAAAGEGVHACTDVTGFGLLGHLREMTSGAGLDAEIRADDVPVAEGVPELAAAGMIPGGTVDNLAHVEPHVDWPGTLSRTRKLILADAQTSGGLLIALEPGSVEALLSDLHGKGIAAARMIGRFTGQGTGRIRVT